MSWWFWGWAASGTTSPPDPTNGNVLLEDGFVLLLEDGGKLLLE
jgi:hypothetical protein